MSRFWHKVAGFLTAGLKNKNPLAGDRQGGVRMHSLLKKCQPQDPPQEPVLQLPPAPRGLVEVMENPDRYPASMKSTLTAPHFSRRLSSTKNCRPPSSNTLSLSFGSSRAKPREGPLQPPCIKAMRTAELILFCSRYDFRLFTAKSVTSNIQASSKVKCSFRVKERGLGL